MATNKHAIIRYQALDKCFRNTGRKYYVEDLIKACNKAIYEFTGVDVGISRRQVFEDVKFMESSQGWNVPLERCRDGHRVYYRYSDTSFSINNQPLNETEESQLKEALMTISRFKGMPQFGWIDEISARLDAGLGLSKSKKKIIEFEQNDYLKGLEFITPLYNAILYSKTVLIKYQSFRQPEPQSIIFFAYFLKQYNNRWYAFGKNAESGFIINLALDRIVDVTDHKRKYEKNTEIDFDEYFEDIVGVTVANETKVERIELKVSNVLFPYIQTKPIHGSQKIKERREDVTIITLDLIPNYELESVILSYGEGVGVLSPASLKNKVQARLEKMIANYQN